MAGNKQKLKLLYLIKIFTEDTDDQHALTLPQIVEKLGAYGIRISNCCVISVLISSASRPGGIFITIWATAGLNCPS